MPHTVYLSPAKINWFLHVTGQRDDGYHTLETVFQQIDWYDTLHIQLRNDGNIHLQGDSCGVAIETNLAYRAAVALKTFAHQHNHSNDVLGADIHLQKNIPTGAGLGGGSSNAATVLLALNQLWHLNFSHSQLQSIGLKLGADVPFFVSEHPAAFAQGIGEQLSPLDLPKREILLVNPNVHVNTGAVFTHPNLPRQHPALTTSLFELQQQLHEQPFQAQHRNDLESVTFELSPEVKMVYNALQHVAPTRMSGSGSTLVACPMSDDESAALKAWVANAPAHWQCRWANTISTQSTNGDIL
ncbi:4-(cytidine 5'-diphospho)-2-C-methyl-D-erythritol kinase [Hydromonas duriensis]|uniref:4-diphosphocytidyl-2-C-methyl-D-erythritol kinase n=1 Tax=Hydromonas duriensis TaxID=1527608 RepID=A0A4R6Y9C8_9BURK|nr:4-(cytidine 5'-diphospho)-2-C-methyl-D-erythritol kinase [Hydromonas duriensis]TDR32038.1 4-diphosphocytidyl-2-C-methyl-D-erythritol kinase [Hydromonas duriensis]